MSSHSSSPSESSDDSEDTMDSADIHNNDAVSLHTAKYGNYSQDSSQRELSPVHRRPKDDTSEKPWYSTIPTFQDLSRSEPGPKKRRNQMKKTESQMIISIESEPPLIGKARSKTERTWKSADHQKLKAQFKKSKQKTSFRYDEALPVKNNDRLGGILDVLNSIETEQNDRKKKAKLEKGKSLVGDELQAVEHDAMIDVLGKHFEEQKGHSQMPSFASTQSNPVDVRRFKGQSHRVGPNVKPKNRNNQTADESLIESLSPRTQRKIEEKKKSLRRMSKPQLRKELKKHKVSQSLTVNPDKQEMIDALVESMFGDKKNGSATPKQPKSTWGSKKKTSAKMRNNKSMDPSFLSSLSPKTKDEAIERRNSWMHMSKAQLQQECKEKHIRRLPSKPTKEEMVNSLFEAEYGTQKASTPRRTKSRTRKKTKQRKTRSHSVANNRSLPAPEVIKEDRSFRYDEPLGISGGAADIVANALSIIDDTIDKDESTVTASEKSKKKRTKSATPKAARRANRGRRAASRDDGPSLRKGGSVPPNMNRGRRRHTHVGSPSERSKKKRGTSSKNKRVSSSKSKKKRMKKTASRMVIEDEHGHEQEPVLKTWKSNDHAKRARHLQGSSEIKTSFRYDEALPVQNDRLSGVFDVLNDIESEQDKRKKEAKLKNGKSLRGEELKAVEGDAMVDVLGKHYDQKSGSKQKQMNGSDSADDMSQHSDSSDEVDPLDVGLDVGN